MATTTARTVGAPRACDLSSISYRQLDYWTREGVIAPVVAARGSGTRRRFTAEQVRQLMVCGELADNGVVGSTGSRVDLLRQVVDVLAGAALVGMVPTFLAVSLEQGVVPIFGPDDLYAVLERDSSVVVVRVPDLPEL